MVASATVDPKDLLLSAWITETARSAVLSGRGLGDPGARAAARARLLAQECARLGVKIRPELASPHAEWIAEVAGTEEETGTLGWFFLQRLGKFVAAHVAHVLPDEQNREMEELGAPDEEAVNKALTEQGVPTAPPPEWPEAPEAKAPGRVRVRIGILGDPHVGLKLSNRLIPAAIEDINHQQVALAAVVGDITQNGQADFFRQAREILDRFQAPYGLTLGNHDMWGGGEGAARGMDNFNAAFDRKPYGVLEADGVRLIFVNSADPRPSPFPPFDMVAGAFSDEPNESVPGGVLSDEMLEWLHGIEPGGPTFIVLHHPPYPYLGLPAITFGLDAKSTQALAEAATRLDAWGIICGHTHRSALHDLSGIPFLEVPSSKEPPFGYGVIEVSDEGWAFNLRPVSDQELVAEASKRFNLIIRRYARGPQEARAFSIKR